MDHNKSTKSTVPKIYVSMGIFLIMKAVSIFLKLLPPFYETPQPIRLIFTSYLHWLRKGKYRLTDCMFRSKWVDASKCIQKH